MPFFIREKSLAHSSGMTSPLLFLLLGLALLYFGREGLVRLAKADQLRPRLATRSNAANLKAL